MNSTYLLRTAVYETYFPSSRIIINIFTKNNQASSSSSVATKIFGHVKASSNSSNFRSHTCTHARKYQSEQKRFKTGVSFARA